MYLLYSSFFIDKNTLQFTYCFPISTVSPLMFVSFLFYVSVTQVILKSRILQLFYDPPFLSVHSYLLLSTAEDNWKMTPLPAIVEVQWLWIHCDFIILTLTGQWFPKDLEDKTSDVILIVTNCNFDHTNFHLNALRLKKIITRKAWYIFLCCINPLSLHLTLYPYYTFHILIPSPKCWISTCKFYNLKINLFKIFLYYKCGMYCKDT